MSFIPRRERAFPFFNPIRIQVKFMLLAVLLCGCGFPAFAADKTAPEILRKVKTDWTAAGLTYPPENVRLVVLKEERLLETWSGKNGAWKLFRTYPILAASGGLGPKLREGDHQVPEGHYKIEYLNPNSNYHLSMKIDYPNAFDRDMAKREGRTGLGGDIFIHGSSVSIGCVAIGNAAIEELYALVADVGKGKIDVVIVPYDFRKRPIPGSGVVWMKGLYETLAPLMP